MLKQYLADSNLYLVIGVGLLLLFLSLFLLILWVTWRIPHDEVAAMSQIPLDQEHPNCKE